MPVDELYSVPALAERLGNKRGGPSQNTIRDWIKNERLQVTRVGRRVMISESQIQDFLRSCNDEK